MSTTLAIHWAVTTHGSWLHGDPRGSWFNGQLIGPDPFLEASERASLIAGSIVLNELEQQLVADEFAAILREHHHRVYAATIQATHIHLLLAPVREEPKTVIARLKRRSAAAVLGHRRQALLRSQADSFGARGDRPRMGRLCAGAVPRSLWTKGNFPVFIFDEYHLGNAIEYIRDHNRRVGLPPDPYDWIAPLYPPSDTPAQRFNKHDHSTTPNF